MMSQLERGGISQEVISGSGVNELTWFLGKKMTKCLWSTLVPECDTDNEVVI